MFDPGWGSVPGDTNAEAIARDRRAVQRVLRNTALGEFMLLVCLAVWYGFSGAPGVLAAAIVVGAAEVATTVSLNSFDTHTFVLIAERRAQLIEQRLDAFRDELASGDLVITARTEHGR